MGLSADDFDEFRHRLDIRSEKESDNRFYSMGLEEFGTFIGSRARRDHIVDEDDGLRKGNMALYSKAIFFIFKSLFTRETGLMSRPEGTQEAGVWNIDRLRQILGQIFGMIKSPREVPTPMHRNWNKRNIISFSKVVFFDTFRQKIDKYIFFLSVRIEFIPLERWLDQGISCRYIDRIE